MSCNKHSEEKGDLVVQVSKCTAPKTPESLFSKLFTRITRFFQRKKRYHCYKCGKYKVKNKFGRCEKPHVKRVRGVGINFACKACVKKQNLQ